MSLWRNFAATIFKIAAVLTVNGIIVISVYICNEINVEALLIFLPCAIVSACIVFPLWGMFIEMCDNIYTIRLIEHANLKLSKQGIDISTALSNAESDSVLKQTDSTWVCRCGTSNSNFAVYCSNCKRKKS